MGEACFSVLVLVQWYESSLDGDGGGLNPSLHSQYYNGTPFCVTSSY